MSNPIGVVIQGGSGFGAGELLRYLTNHPNAEVAAVISSSQSGQLLAQAHPHLAGFYKDLKFDSAIDWARFSKFKQRVVFLALPHGHSAGALREIDSKGGSDTRIVDLSADFRLTDERIHAKTYADVAFDKDLRGKFVYGLTELFREQIASALRIANPGCLATASILAAAPLVAKRAGDIVGSICFDAKTGTSGAGRAPQDSMHHPHRHGNFEAYKVLAHRHEPEIRQALGLPVSGGIGCMFVPHLLPTSRGIFVTMYVQLQRETTEAEISDLYRKTFAQSPFVRFRVGTPRLHDVVGTNFCDLSVAARGNQVVVMAALDNLGKGMAGQAIQNMNLMFGLKEDCGLMQPALGIS